MPTRYGSSPMVSSTRPQRASRTTSSTGARPWCTPTRAHVGADAARPSRATRSGSNDAPQLTAAPGRRWPPRSAKPARHSSCASAGMPKRFAATIRCCARMSDERPDRRVDGRRAERPRQLAEPAGRHRVEVDVVVHVVLVRGDILAVVGCADPHAVQLRDLLGRWSSRAMRASTRSSTASAASRHGMSAPARCRS